MPSTMSMRSGIFVKLALLRNRKAFNCRHLQSTADGAPVEEFLGKHLGAGRAFPTGVTTAGREVLSLYRDIWRATRIFTWPNDQGVPWKDVLRLSARREFEAAQFERDPEAVRSISQGCCVSLWGTHCLPVTNGCQIGACGKRCCPFYSREVRTETRGTDQIRQPQKRMKDHVRMVFPEDRELVRTCSQSWNSWPTHLGSPKISTGHCRWPKHHLNTEKILPPTLYTLEDASLAGECVAVLHQSEQRQNQEKT